MHGQAQINIHKIAHTHTHTPTNLQQISSVALGSPQAVSPTENVQLVSPPHTNKHAGIHEFAMTG